MKELTRIYYMVEQKSGKNRLVKAQPLPTCKMENDSMNFSQLCC